MPREPKRKLYDLYNLTLTEVSSVPKGDNYGARVVMLKDGSRGTGGDMRTTFTKAEDVIEAVEAEAFELRKHDPTLSPEQARTRIWELHDQLAQTYHALSGAYATLSGDGYSDRAAQAAVTAPVLPYPEEPDPLEKGADAVSVADEAALQLRKADPTLTPEQARTMVWDRYPELAAEYQRQAHG